MLLPPSSSETPSPAPAAALIPIRLIDRISRLTLQVDGRDFSPFKIIRRKHEVKAEKEDFGTTPFSRYTIRRPSDEFLTELAGELNDRIKIHCVWARRSLMLSDATAVEPLRDALLHRLSVPWCSGPSENWPFNDQYSFCVADPMQEEFRELSLQVFNTARRPHLRLEAALQGPDTLAGARLYRLRDLLTFDAERVWEAMAVVLEPPVAVLRRLARAVPEGNRTAVALHDRLIKEPKGYDTNLWPAVSLAEWTRSQFSSGTVDA